MRNGLVKLCATALVAVALPAGAAISNLGTLEAGTTPFSGSWMAGPAPIAFSDFFVFDLSPNGRSSYSLMTFPLSALSVNTTYASMTLFDPGTDGAIGGSGFNGDHPIVSNAAELSPVLSPLLSMSTLGNSSANGKLYLYVNGFSTGSEGGSYTGAITVSPVPEPEIWAMMLVGAGLVGFRLRHRSKKLAANRFG